MAFRSSILCEFVVSLKNVFTRREKERLQCRPEKVSDRQSCIKYYTCRWRVSNFLLKSNGSDNRLVVAVVDRDWYRDHF